MVTQVLVNCPHPTLHARKLGMLDYTGMIKNYERNNGVLPSSIELFNFIDTCY